MFFKWSNAIYLVFLVDCALMFFFGLGLTIFVFWGLCLLLVSFVALLIIGSLWDCCESDGIFYALVYAAGNTLIIGCVFYGTYDVWCFTTLVQCFCIVWFLCWKAMNANCLCLSNRFGRWNCSLLLYFVCLFFPFVLSEVYIGISFLLLPWFLSGHSIDDNVPCVAFLVC